MEVLKKIGVFISEPRQVDYYKNFLKEISSDLLIIIDDFKNNQNSIEYKKIRDFCNQNNFNYTSSKLLVNKNQKVSLIIGAGNKSYHNTSISYSKRCVRYFKYIYAKTLGVFVEKLKLNKFFFFIIKRNLTCGGMAAKLDLKEEVPIEYFLGYKKILYPRGMDIYYNHPGPMRSKYFDFFFSISSFDDNVLKKNINKKSFMIGYPRYDLMSQSQLDADLKSKINFKKKIFLWITSDMIEENLKNQNILNWFDSMNFLAKHHNVIFRPHPNTLKNNENLKEQIINSNFIIDFKEERNLKKLYDNCDLVIADYGGPIFSALYCKKDVLLLNVMTKLNKKFKLDLMIRDYIYNISKTDLESSSIAKILNDPYTLNQIKNKSSHARKVLFSGNSSELKVCQIIHKIFKETLAA